MLTTHVRASLAAQENLITAEQLRDHGLSTGGIRHLLRTGDLRALRRGVYADGEVWHALDAVGRRRLHTRAALITVRRGGVVSHDSAAHEIGMDVLIPRVPFAHITRSGFTGAWTKAGVKHHLARFLPSQVVEVDGLSVLGPARTAVDIAREHGAPFGEIACDAALRMGTTRAELVAAYEPMVSWSFITRTRQAVAFADPGAQTVAETLGRLLVTEAGLGPIETQFPIRLPDGRVRFGDLRVGCHVFEVDGHAKLVPAVEGGLAEAPSHEVLWAQQKRDRDLHREGLGVSHIIWQDFWPPHRAAALVRIRAEYADTCRLRGTRLPEHLSENARRIRDARR